MNAHHIGKRESNTPEGAFGLIHRRLATSIVDVLRGYGVRADPVPKDGAPNSGVVVVAVIGFAGEHMRGSLVLRASLESVDAWRGPFDAEKGTDVCDMLGELANMVLGRLKGKLLGEGLPILMSTPTTARGPAVILAPAGGPEEQLAFAGEGWRLSVRVDAAFDEAFGLEESPSAVAAEAGDIMLF